jgi:hypothetical protein
MAPQGHAPKHEGAELLNEWENLGCPTNTVQEGTIGEILQAAINRGPHKSELEPDAIANVVENEVDNKVVKGQVSAVLWDDIKDNHPGQLTGVCRGRRRCGNPHGKMGHPRWFSGSSTAAKETSGILLCMATGTNGTMPAGGTKLATNGMGGLCTIFLRCIKHGKRH